MNIYDLNTRLNFGKYNGSTLEDVAEVNAMYIEWCIINVDFFLIDIPIAKEIKKNYPNFLDSEKGKKAYIKKIKNYLKERKERENYNDYRNNYENDFYSDYNNEYYNDNLDIDQQSPEWWDSL